MGRQIGAGIEFQFLVGNGRSIPTSIFKISIGLLKQFGLVSLRMRRSSRACKKEKSGAPSSDIGLQVLSHSL